MCDAPPAAGPLDNPAARLDNPAPPLDNPAARLDDPAAEQRLARLDTLLARLEQIPGRTAELAVQAVETLVDVYGEALCRVRDNLADRPDLLAALAADELLRHLMLLHRIHPDPPTLRVDRAVRDAAQQARAGGARVELVEVHGDVAVVRVASGTCGSCGDTAALHDLVRDEILAAAPEVARIDFAAPAPSPALIPVAAVGGRTRTATAGLTTEPPR
jgi:hypothetical protein